MERVTLKELRKDGAAPPCKAETTKAEWSHLQHLKLWMKHNPGKGLKEFNAELAASYREHVLFVKAHQKGKG